MVANALISACSYEGNLPSLLISFKTGAGFPYAKIFGQWIAQLAPELFQLCEKIIPVPSDFYRLLSRHYNPAAMIAREASKHAHVFHKYDPFYLKKIKHIPKSRRLPFKDRITRNRNCYEISKKQAPPESVLLIDDLITTGATLNTCSNVLAHGGVKKIYILTLAKRFLQQ